MQRMMMFALFFSSYFGDVYPRLLRPLWAAGAPRRTASGPSRLCGGFTLECCDRPWRKRRRKKPLEELKNNAKDDDVCSVLQLRLRGCLP